MSISGGINWVVVMKALQNWVVACTGLAADHIIWGQQQAPRPTQPGIIMRLMLEQDNLAPELNHEINPLVFNDIAVTISGDVCTAANHGLLTGDGPVLLGSTQYWVIKLSAGTFSLATSFTNAMNGVSTGLVNGSGTVSDTPETLRAGQEINIFQRSLLKGTLTLECYTDVGVGMDMATSILWRVSAKRLLPTPIAILEAANIGIIESGRVRAMGGTQGQYLFEPRAMLDVVLYLASEDKETGTIIDRVGVTDTTNGDTFDVPALITPHGFSDGFSSGFEV